MVQASLVSVNATKFTGVVKVKFNIFEKIWIWYKILSGGIASIV